MSKFFITACIAVAAFASPAAVAHSYNKGDIQVRHPWARATAPGAEVAAGYLEVRNTGKEPDRLIGASTPVAASVEMHATTHEQGVMKMREVTSIEAPARKRQVLGPGGTHLMIVGLKKPLVKGQRIPLVLRFERAGDVHVELEVQVGGSTKPHH